MIWATVEDIRAELDNNPDDDAAVQREIDRAVRTLDGIAIRYPRLNTDQRADDTKTRADVVAAVAELIQSRRDRVKAKAATPGLEIVERGGSIKSATLTVDAGARSSSSGSGADRDSLVPASAIEALQAAGMIGGSVASW
jgi:hypothetical protein